MKRNRKIIRYSTQYGKKARVKRMVSRTIITVVIAAILISLGFIITGYLVDNDFHPFRRNDASQVESSSSEQSSADVSSEDSSSSDETDSSDAEAQTPSTAEVLSGAIEISNQTLLSDQERSDFLNEAAQNGYQSVIIEVKNTDGNVLYNSKVALATTTGAISADAFDLDAVVSEIKAAGLQVVARMSALQDPISAHVDYGTSYKYSDTDYTWLDNSASLGGKAWLNPYLDNTQNYLTDLAAELADAGCDVILLDQMIFPTSYTSKLNQNNTTVARQDMLSELYNEIQTAAGDTTVVFCFDAESYFGKSTQQYDGTPDGIQNLSAVCPKIDLTNLTDLKSYTDQAADIDFSSLTPEVVSFVLDAVKSAHPDAQIIPMFAQSDLSDEILSCLEEYDITLYCVDADN
jgi:cytoskeletal protein RodZ